MTARLILDPCPSPAWQCEGHLQTIAAMKWGRRVPQQFVRQRLDTPDDDFVDIDWAGQQSHTHCEFDGPALVIFHGLEGSSQSHYAQAIGAHFVERGWMVAVAHFRGCSGEPNRLARSYFSGDSQDVGFILEQVRSQLPQARWHAAGVSLGGNALLKYIGEQGRQLSWLNGVAGISVPVDLVATGMQLQTSLVGRYLYTPHFLASMRHKLRQKAGAFPGAVNWRKALQARTLLQFDDAYTGPVHGFRSGLDYWARCSSKYFLQAIQVPTLLLIARNDPFIPEASLPGPDQASDHVVLHYPYTGGHAGFASGAGRGELTWLPRRLERFFTLNQ
ncbi:YheT family hydrolase [Advenella sp. S44]|uniref:YheT family hydrolase n=1 Tax=Advenella sp. S44 TaxID=1982755 RepID=UPI001F5B8635|nr:alpha/beta fold hydrolase [Advenella sp. S44]